MGSFRPLILASGSPRRRVLLRRAGFSFTVVSPDVDEEPIAGESPAEMVTRLSLAKARAVVADRGALVLGADTTVALDGESLAKPADADDAAAMLLRLADRSHEVLTGFCIASGGRSVASAVERSVVWFGPVDSETAAAYVATGEPMDKAGAYAIQGMGRRFVTRIEGSFTNVMGLPMERVEPALILHGATQERSDDS